MTNRRINGFSLVEVTIAIGVVGFALIAILGLLPVGTRSARESADATRTPLIARDAYNRARAGMMSNNSGSANYFGPYPTSVASFFFYTLDGSRTSDGSRTGELFKVPYPNDQPQFYANISKPTDFYRAKVTVNTFDQAVGYQTYDPRLLAGSSANLLCATIEVAWPVDKSNGGITGSANKATYTFLVRKP